MMNVIRRLFRRPAQDPKEELATEHRKQVKKAKKTIAALWKLWERTPTDKKGILREKVHDYTDTLHVYSNLRRLGRITIEDRVEGLQRLNHMMKATKKEAEMEKLSIIGGLIQTWRENRVHREELEREQEALRIHLNGQPRLLIF